MQKNKIILMILIIFLIFLLLAIGTSYMTIKVDSHNCTSDIGYYFRGDSKQNCENYVKEHCPKNITYLCNDKREVK